ncbi:acylphosphatase [Cryobacterium melibiosiphilum]|uniref:Acylphosphatase n=1 Tax=Cryobacterium melibiosiphilum TaxID=995039 RepID=A0A3A5MTR7_9MICO|nr:acylphosphatase [Cryobacterium melibiosiphilum]RJT89366.1 acylphosphatase [Cryobacterium melibiosiphilum]
MQPEQTQRKRVIVRGQVQGVGFRYYAQAEAEKIGVSGFVQNHADGSVEAQVEGAAASVARMLDWLATGPPWAVVDSVAVTDAPLEFDTQFRVRGGD